MDDSRLIQFYLGQEPDNEGRMIEEIWTLTEMELEASHNYIQWLFPLQEPSRFNPDAPLLTPDEIVVFRDMPELRKRVLKSLLVMLEFYGLKFITLSSQQMEVIPTDDFADRREVWMSPGNHNYLRLTRILKSLRYLGLDPFAQALFRCLDSLYRAEGEEYINPEAYQYWKQAIL